MRVFFKKKENPSISENSDDSGSEEENTDKIIIKEMEYIRG